MSVIATRRPLHQASAVPRMIAGSSHSKLPSPGNRKVNSVATSMPAPAHTMPLRAVTGELMRFRPMMNRKAVTR